MDSTGAVVVGASVTATQTERNLSWSAQTNETGTYAFPRLPAGLYEVTVEAPGFRRAIQKDIRLQVNDRARVDVQMQLGQVTEVVEVTDVAPLLQTQKTEVGEVITSSTNVSLPLNGRNFAQLTLLVPGTTAPNLDSFTDGQRTTGTGGRPFVNGNREQANNFLLDGLDNNHATSNFTAYEPNIDAIAEFKIITNNPSAEFGNAQGGIINLTIKSGTNDFHGTLFEFFRNDKLNANGWARNWRAQERVATRHNIFGGTIGGPVVRNKMFFFTDYQGLRRAMPGTAGSFTVIPSEFRQGDFSRLRSENNIQLYNPFSLNRATGQRDPFPNNQIPVSLRNVVATNLFQKTDLYPAPINSALRFNQVNVPVEHLNTDQGDVKIDYKLSRTDDLSVRYSKGRQDIPSLSSFPLTYNAINKAPFQNGVVNWTRTFSTSVVNELRAGVNRIGLNDVSDPKDLGNIAEQLGIRNGNERGPGLLSLSFTGAFASAIGNAQVGTWRTNVSNNFQVSDNLTILRGRHMLKTGFQFLRRQGNTLFTGNFGNQGGIDFNGLFTRGPNANSPAARTGFAEADFFLGLPFRLTRGPDGGGWGHRSSVIGAYFQDDWRVSDTLTLNLGMRWDYTSPFVEVADRQANFEPFSGKHLIAGKDGANRALYASYYRDFQPRVGFAWTPASLGRKTVLRGSYTISSFMEGMGTNLRLPFNPPFLSEFSTLYDALLFPGSTTDQGLTSLTSLDPFRGANIRLWDPLIQPARVQQWSFIVERQLPGQTVMSVGYVGQHGTHLVNVIQYFQRRPQPNGTVLPSPYLAGNPALSRITAISGTETNANQRYDSLQVGMRRRLVAGFEYMLSYTYSKTMVDARGFFATGGGQAGGLSARAQNIYDRRAEWGPAFFDTTHNFVYSGVYELPFGAKRKFGSNWNRLVDGALGGWRVSGIFTTRTGFPLTVTANDLSGTTSQGPRADRLADGKGPREVGPGKTWLDKNAFRQPVRGTFGNSGNGVVRGPGLVNLDASLQKDFRISESKRFEVRADFFSVTNTPIFAPPNLNVNAATFGEVSGAQGARQIQLGLKFHF